MGDVAAVQFELGPAGEGQAGVAVEGDAQRTVGPVAAQDVVPELGGGARRPRRPAQRPLVAHMAVGLDALGGGEPEPVEGQAALSRRVPAGQHEGAERQRLQALDEHGHVAAHDAHVVPDDQAPDEVVEQRLPQLRQRAVGKGGGCGGRVAAGRGGERLARHRRTEAQQGPAVAGQVEFGHVGLAALAAGFQAAAAAEGDPPRRHVDVHLVGGHAGAGGDEAGAAAAVQVVVVVAEDQVVGLDLQAARGGGGEGEAEQHPQQQRGGAAGERAVGHQGKRSLNTRPERSASQMKPAAAQRPDGVRSGAG